MNGCPMVSFFASKTGYYEASLEQGVGGDLTLVDLPLIPISGDPPETPPLVVDVAFHIQDEGTKANIAGALVTIGSRSDYTNSMGIALFQDMAIAKYSFLVQASGYHDRTGTLDTGAEQDPYIYMYSLDQPAPPPIVEITVNTKAIYPDNTAVPGVLVALHKKTGGFSQSKYTGTNGVATFNQVPTGEYQINADVKVWDVTIYDGMGTVVLTLDAPIQPTEYVTVRMRAPSPQGAGTVSPEPATYTLIKDSVVPLGATAASGYRFSEWVINEVSFVKNPTNIKADRDLDITCFFVEGSGGISDAVDGIIKWITDHPVEAMFLGGGFVIVLTAGRGGKEIIVVRK